MNNEDSIKWLNALKDNTRGRFVADREIQAAIDAGIAALMVGSDDDCISRKEVKDMLVCMAGVYPAGRKYDVSELIADFTATVDSMQPKAPKRPIGEWQQASADKYISSAHHFYLCTKCGKLTLGKQDFCPKCGSFNMGVTE